MVEEKVSTQLAWQLGPPLATVGDIGGPAFELRSILQPTIGLHPDQTSEAVDSFQPVRCMLGSTIMKAGPYTLKI